MFTTQKMQHIISKDGCTSGANKILSDTFTPPPNFLAPPQQQYFLNL